MPVDHGARNIHMIPHFYEPREIPDAAATERFRQNLGVEPAVTLYGVFGFLRETKRILPCIDAFRRLNAVRPSTALLLAGDVVSGDLSRLLANQPAHPDIHRRKETPPRRRFPHRRGVRRLLPEPSLPSGRQRDVRHRHPADGDWQAGDRHGRPGNSRHTADRLPPRPMLGPDRSLRSFRSEVALITEFPAIARGIGIEAATYIRAKHSPRRRGRTVLASD